MFPCLNIFALKLSYHFLQVNKSSFSNQNNLCMFLSQPHGVLGASVLCGLYGLCWSGFVVIDIVEWGGGGVFIT